MRKQNTLILFTKSARICRVKTRLWPYLNHRQCLSLHKHLTNNIVKQHAKSNNYNFVIYLTHKAIYHSPYNINVKLQHGSDLGARMYHAISVELKSAQRVVLIGSDCMELSRDLIEQAFIKLGNHNNNIVFAPTSDGGYCLVGMRKPYSHLFNQINWGTDKVLNQTLQCASKKSYKTHLLKTLNDIDTIDDLRQLWNMKKLPEWARKYVKDIL